jgi:hypothetical protein
MYNKLKSMGKIAATAQYDFDESLCERDEGGRFTRNDNTPPWEQEEDEVTAATAADVELDTWFERDRAHVELRDKNTQETLIEWWDEDVSEAVEDGFLDPDDWEGSAIDYARSLGVISKRAGDERLYQEPGSGISLPMRGEWNWDWWETLKSVSEANPELNLEQAILQTAFQLGLDEDETKKLRDMVIEKGASTVTAQGQFSSFEEARSNAKRRARDEGKELYVVAWYDGTYEVTDRQPLLGEWWHVYPDGMIMQRGTRVMAQSEYVEEARKAFETGAPSPYLHSSPMDMAWRVGLWWREQGHDAPPESVSPSRGYKWKVDGIVLDFKDSSEYPKVVGRRVAARDESIPLQSGKSLRVGQHESGMYWGEIRDESGSVESATNADTMSEVWKWVRAQGEQTADGEILGVLKRNPNGGKLAWILRDESFHQVRS